jgi:hypothetical protein
MNKQEIFDKSVLHIAQQKRPALNEHGYLRYRVKAKDGTQLTSCVGHLMPLTSYRPGMEYDPVKWTGGSIPKLIADGYVLPAFLADPAHQQLLIELDAVHVLVDWRRGPMVKALERIAELCGVKPDIVRKAMPKDWNKPAKPAAAVEGETESVGRVA